MSKRSLNAEDPNKKARPTEAPAAAEDPQQKHAVDLEQLSLVQDEIEKLNAEADEEKMKIDRKYSEKKRPHLKRRNELSSTIPGFWLSCGHNVLSKVIDDEDAEVLAHLVDLWVDETENSFKITFKFGKGASAWLDGDTLWKEFKAEPGGSATVTASPLKWKPGKNLVQKAAEKEDGMTFFQWFTETGDEDELAQLLRDELFADPMIFFGREPDLDEDDEEAEEAEEDV